MRNSKRRFHGNAPNSTRIHIPKFGLAFVLIWSLVPTGNVCGQDKDTAQPSSPPKQPPIHFGANGTATVSPSDTQSEMPDKPMADPPAVPNSLLITKQENQSSLPDEIPSKENKKAIGTFAVDDSSLSASSRTTVVANPTNQDSAMNPLPGKLPPISQNGLRTTSNDKWHKVESGTSSSINSAAQQTGFGGGVTPPQNERQAMGISDPSSASTGIQNPTNDGKYGRPGQIPRKFDAQPIGTSMETDPKIGKATLNQSIPNTGNSNSKLAGQLMDRYRVDKAPDPIPGQPVSMAEMLRQPLSPSQRQAMVGQYWETYLNWANLLSSAQHVRWLGSIPSPSSAVDSALLAAAKSAARNDMLEAEIKLGKSQAILSNYSPMRNSQTGPLPSDRPIVGSYTTNYALYQSRGMVPSRFRGIDNILPKKYKLIADRAATVQLAQAAANNAKQSLPTRQTTLASVLEAARVWQTAEHDLIDSVISYNKTIADYSLATFGRFNSGSPEQLAATLVSRPSTVSGQVAIRDARPSSPRSTYVQPSSRLGSNMPQGSTLNASRQSQPLVPGRIQNPKLQQPFTAGPSSRTANAADSFGNASPPISKTAPPNSVIRQTPPGNNSFGPPPANPSFRSGSGPAGNPASSGNSFDSNSFGGNSFNGK